MEIIKKEIKIVDNGNYYININLINTFNLNGIYDEDNSGISSDTYDIGIPQYITGTSLDRLNEIKTLNPTTPYIIGVNGCTSITTLSNGTIQKVSYIIDGISFSTDLINNNFTTYSFNSKGNIGPDYPLYKRDSMIGIIEKPTVKSYIKIVRENYSVMDNHYRMSSLNNLNELEFYAGGNDKIFNIYTK